MLPMPAEREREFDREMRDLYQWSLEIDYTPNYYLRMLGELGGRGTAEKLLASGLENISQGLMRLAERHRLDLSVEALVLQEPWRNYLTPIELETAQERLRALGDNA